MKLLQTIIKIINKMGNIQIKERPRKINSIFGQRPRHSSRSPFRQLISPGSPYYKDFSPIRYSPISHQPKRNIRQSLRQYAQKSPRPLQRQSQFKSRQKQLKRNTQRSVNKNLKLNDNSIDISNENKEKCEEIIKKVRNFNDFLVELKSKLKYDSNKSQNSKERGQISLSVKLQNERVELQKYKRLVERELSKTHSIQNINIQSNNGQKILTIQYEQLQQKSQDQHIKEQPSKFFLSNQHNNLPQHYNKSKVVRPQPQSQCSQVRASLNKRVEEATALWMMLDSKTNELKDLLQQEEQTIHNGQQLKDYLQIKQRLVKVSQLYATMQSANRQSIQIQKKIKVLLS